MLPSEIPWSLPMASSGIKRFDGSESLSEVVIGGRVVLVVFAHLCPATVNPSPYSGLLL